MKIKTTDLMQVLTMAHGVLERRNTIPVLGTVLIDAGPCGLLMTATDLDFEITMNVSHDYQAGEQFCLGSTVKLMRALRQSGGADVEISRAETSGIDIRSGDLVAQFSDYLPADDFPLMKNTLTDDFPFVATLGSDTLTAWRHAMTAVSTEQTRYYLNGLYIHHLNENMPWHYAAVATDGHRLMRAILPWPETKGEFPKAGVIIPTKTVRFLLGLRSSLGNQAVTFGVTADGKKCQFRTTVKGIDVVLTSKLVDGTFPDYSRVIPKGREIKAIFNTPELRRAAASIHALGSEKTKAVKITFTANNAAVVSGYFPETGKASFQVECDFPGWKGGVEMFIGFNGNYLLTLLDNVAAARVVMSWDGDANLGWTVNSNSLPTHFGDVAAGSVLDAVLMPMRV